MNQFGKQAFSLISIMLLMISSQYQATILPTLKSTIDVQKIAEDEEKFGVYVFKTTVRIYNNLDNGLQLTVHCKSKNDDLGPHVVANKEFYEWKFRINFSATTLFFCGLTWIGGSGTYDIFKGGRDSKRCPSKCIWKVRNDGVYGYGYAHNNPETQDIYFTWPKP